MSGKKSLNRRHCNEKLKIVVLSRLSSAPTLVKHSSSPVSPLYSPTSCWSPQGIRVFIKLTGQGGRGRSRGGTQVSNVFFFHLQLPCLLPAPDQTWPRSMFLGAIMDRVFLTFFGFIDTTINCLLALRFPRT